MNNKISVIIISGEEHNYDEIVMSNLPEWFEREFEITVVPNAQNILIDINRNNGVDVIISIGDDIDLSPLNLMSFEFRKKWVHLDHYNKDLVISDAIVKCMEIISDITNYTSIVLGKDNENNTLKQVSIVPIDDKKIVAVVVTNTGHVENKQSNIPETISMDEMIKACELINRKLVGTKLSDINSKLEYEIKPIIASQIKAYERVMDFFYDAFNDFNVKNSDIFFQGKTNILKQPEYDSPEKIKNMIGKLENMDLIKKIETDDKDVNIFIGEENKFDPSVTVVRTSYNIDGEEGTIAIIGPKRMEYDKVVTLLNYLKNYIER